MKIGRGTQRESSMERLGLEEFSSNDCLSVRRRIRQRVDQLSVRRRIRHRVDQLSVRRRIRQ